MGRSVTAYTPKELSDLLALWDELEALGEQKRFDRWGKRATSAFMLFEVAGERGLKLATTGKPWSYDHTLKALRRSEKLAAPQPRPGSQRTGVPLGQRSPASGPLASATPKSAAAVFSFFEKDLGAFLRPEDRERSQRGEDRARQKKIHDLTIELGEKTQTRADLEMYISVYNRVIGRLEHRIQMLQSRGSDPDDLDQTEAIERDEEDREAVSAHQHIAVVPGVVRRTTRAR